MERLSTWRKGVVIAAVVLMGALPAMAGDFRETTWGMSIAEVKEIEGDAEIEEVFQGVPTLGYQREFEAGNRQYSALVFYEFVNDALFGALYAFDNQHTDKYQYIRDFFRLKIVLDQKYGKTEMNVDWRNTLYKDDKQQWGTAVAAGHLAFSSEWKTKTSTIFLALSGDNFKIQHSLRYDTRDKKLLKQARKQAKASQDSAL